MAAANRVTPDERAALAAMVIGPDRRSKLIDRYANGLALAHGMRLDAARRYAEPFVDEADPHTVLAVGQVWSRRDGQVMPGDVLADLVGRERDESFTVEGFEGDMVCVGEGRQMNVMLFRDLWLTAWPEEFTLDGDESPFAGPVPPAESATDDDAEQASDEDNDRFDPRCVWFLIHRARKDGIPRGEGIPLLSAPYRAVNWKKPEYEPCYGNALDVVAYIGEHLADYRAGWPDYAARWDPKEGFWDSFNELDGGCACDVVLAAYIGWWLWQRVRSDVVREYGGSVDDYDVLLMWAPGHGDEVLKAAPWTDPEWEIPPDHALALCAGQESLFGAESEAA